MFQLISLLLAMYVSWRLIALLALPAILSWPLIALILIVSQHHRLVATFWGSRASPEIPGQWLMLLGWLYGAILLATCLLLLIDLAGLVLYVIHQPTGGFLLTAIPLRATIGVSALLLAAYAVKQAVRIPDISSVEVHIPHLAPELDGYRIAQLSDLHASRLLQGPWMDAVVDKTNRLQADLIVISGDIVDGKVSDRIADVAPLARLQAKDGVYAIVGNHEYYANYQAWLTHFRTLNLNLLLNEHRVIGADSASFILAGITDATAAQHQQARPDIDQALQGAPDHLPIILLSHRPTEAKKSAAAGVQLQLSGHTHGGQIWGFHKLVENANDGFVAGFYQVQEMLLYVHRGTGLWAGFPLRLGVPSEITEITLRSAAP